MNILTRKDLPPALRRAAPQAAGEEPADLLERVIALESDKARLTAQLEAETRAKDAAIADAQREEEECAALGRRVEDLQIAYRASEAAAAQASAEAAGLRQQLAREASTIDTLKASLAEALAAAGRSTTIVQPAAKGELPTYEMEISRRDINDRAQRVILRPITEAKA